MFRSNSNNFPAIETFADAKKYLQEAKPITRGPNTGTVPLQTSRRAADTYHIFERQTRHPFNDAVQTEIVCQMYATEIYRLFEDGTTFISSYSSRSTHDVLRGLTGKAISASGVRFQKETLLFPEYMRMFLPYNYMGFDAPFDGDGLWYQVTPGGKVHILRHGYAFGPGRQNVVKHAESLIRAVHQTCRAAAIFAGKDPDFFRIDLPSFARVATPEQAVAHMQWVLTKHDWAPGNDVTAEIMSDMFEGSRHIAYMPRLAWTKLLRQELKTSASYTTEKDYRNQFSGEVFYDYLERVALGIG